MRVIHSKFIQILLAVSAALLATAANALPALQLGPTTIPSSGWTYNTTTDTWVYTGSQSSTANLSAFANATRANGGNGAFAWDGGGASTRYAYLVVGAVPNLGNIGDLFDISITGATLFDSGYGRPPEEDSNDLAPHGIYSTYYEIYRFAFDGPLVDIFNTQPPGGDTAKGYREDFQIKINSLASGVTGLHFDLFTVIGNGTYNINTAPVNNLVKAVAPFSHDAQWNPVRTPDNPTPPDVPAPGTLLLLGLSLFGLGFTRRKA